MENTSQESSKEHGGRKSQSDSSTAGPAEPGARLKTPGEKMQLTVI